MFGVQDLFVVGIGFEIAGAILLALGLLASVSDVALRTATFLGANTNAAAGLIEDRVRGLVGMASLVVGFGLQAVGYGLTVALDHPTRGAVAGVVIAGLAPIGFVWGIERATRKPLRRRMMIQLARYDMETRTTGDLPSAEMLRGLGVASGYPKPAESEGDREYATRVFGVTDMRNGE